jgi:hypothetical protein
VLHKDSAMDAKRYVDLLFNPGVTHRDPEAHIRKQLMECEDLIKRMEAQSVFLNAALREVLSRKKRSRRTK